MKKMTKATYLWRVSPSADVRRIRIKIQRMFTCHVNFVVVINDTFLLAKRVTSLTVERHS